MPFQAASSSSSSRETSPFTTERTQVWPLRSQVTTVRSSEVVSDRSSMPSRVALSASPGFDERVAVDHGVGDPLAVLLVEDRAGVAPVDLVGARPDRLPAELARVVGEGDVADLLVQQLRGRRDGGDLRGRRPLGGGRDVLDARAAADEHDGGEGDGQRAGHQPRTRPPDPPEPSACGRPAVPVAAPRRRHALDARAQGERRAGALAGGEDRVAPLLLQGERGGERWILGSPRLDPPALVGFEVSVDVGDKRRLVVSREVVRLVDHDHQESRRPNQPPYSLPGFALRANT